MAPCTPFNYKPGGGVAHDDFVIVTTGQRHACCRDGQQQVGMDHLHGFDLWIARREEGEGERRSEVCEGGVSHTRPTLRMTPMASSLF